ncbi:Casein kinase II subunit alpha' [Dissostichus eleginoides]|uniref:Casein kinase II subunit alpha n=1 Tax=Dissostichus eleginoides TaxID=100907 RepID=A0AAD9C825_DISEL|nr:Casein kinase II subunit alpha' [Dissostichus eleginoides]
MPSPRPPVRGHSDGFRLEENADALTTYMHEQRKGRESVTTEEILLRPVQEQDVKEGAETCKETSILTSYRVLQVSCVVCTS